jgi:hypothetical protein
VDFLEALLKNSMFSPIARKIQESFQKNPPKVTPILYMELNRQYEEKLCAKERNNRNLFSEIIMDLGKYFPCKWGKNRLFQESFQKNPPGVTPILF